MKKATFWEKGPKTTQKRKNNMGQNTVISLIVLTVGLMLAHYLTMIYLLRKEPNFPNIFSCVMLFVWGVVLIGLPLMWCYYRLIRGVEKCPPIFEGYGDPWFAIGYWGAWLLLLTGHEVGRSDFYFWMAEDVIFMVLEILSGATIGALCASKWWKYMLKRRGL